MKKIFAIIAIIMLVMISHRPAVAAVPVGITVAPAVQNIIIQPSETSLTFNTTVTNTSNAPLFVTVEARDFMSFDQTGNLRFLDTSPIAISSPHGLAGSLSIAYNQLALGAGESQIVPVTIVNADKLAIGGHYTAITFKLTGSGNSTGNRVLINQVVASLIFVKTAGTGTQTTNLVNVQQSAFVTTMPRQLIAVFANTGNTQTILRGSIQIVGRFTKLQTQGVINPESSLILPESQRLFLINIPPFNKYIWPGVYHLKIMYRHDGQTDYQIYQKTFVYVSWPILITIFGLIILMVLWITGHIKLKFLKRLYKRR